MPRKRKLFDSNEKDLNGLHLRKRKTNHSPHVWSKVILRDLLLIFNHPSKARKKKKGLFLWL